MRRWGQLGHSSKGTKKTKEKISWHKLPGLEAKFTQCPPTKDILVFEKGERPVVRKENIRDPGIAWYEC